MVKSYGTVSVDGKVSDADLEYLEKVANGTITDVDKNALTSRAYGRAAVVTDVGISFAKNWKPPVRNGHWASHPNTSAWICSTTTSPCVTTTTAISATTNTTTRKRRERRHRGIYRPR